LLSSVMGVGRLRGIFSRTFDKIGRLIGRHDVMSFGFFPGFTIIILRNVIPVVRVEIIYVECSQ